MASVSDLSIRYGSSTNDHGGKILQVEDIYKNPDFNSYLNRNDVSVLKLADDIEFGDNAQPIGLATEEPAPGTDVFVTGWGDRREGGGSTSQLMGVEVNTISRDECNRDYQPSYNITEDMICAGVSKGGKDACQVSQYFHQYSKKDFVLF